MNALNDSYSRRSFIAKGALASSLLILPRGMKANSSEANSRLRVALIGVGGRGKAHLQGLRNEQFVAFCDVDQDRGREKLLANEQTGPILRKFSEAKWFKDYRVMFEEMADEIDAVAISTPDHSHFPAALAAAKLGKHILVEKPLCRTITEVRQLHAAAKEAGVVTQMGNQGRASEGIRLAREWIRGGAIGEVHTVHAWTDRPRKPWFHEPDIDIDGAEEEAVPETLDWDLWLGSAPTRPYSSLIAPAKWRGFVDYGCGALGDMGCHQFDAPFYALDLFTPTTISAASTELYPNTFPASTSIHYSFPANDWRGPLDLHWYDGPLRPPQPVPGFEFNPSGGSIFYGTEGIMHVGTHSRSARLLPEDFMQKSRASLPEKSIPRVKGGHFREWTNAIRNGAECGSNFDYAAPLTELVLLGIAAVRANARLEWDSEGMRFPNRPEADVFLGPVYDYRPGWGV